MRSRPERLPLTAMPTLAPTRSPCAANRSISAIAATTVSATGTASDRSGPMSRRITNSSPPTPLGDLQEQAVARFVAQRVIHRLEPVDVEQQQRDLSLAARRRREHLSQSVAEIRAVGELGKLVLPCEARNLLHLLGELTVSLRDPSLEDGRVDRVGEQPEDDGRPEEQMLLPVRAEREVERHADDRDGRGQKQV